MIRPDYEALSKQNTFRWFLTPDASALREVTGISICDCNLNAEAGIELYKTGRKRLFDIFGPDVPLAQIGTPAISYGHLNCLGSELIFPENGEVGHQKICESLEQGIQLLKKPIDYATSGMAPFYLDYMKELEKAFPGEKVAFTFKYEGPITTAYGMRGADVFLDPYDTPELFKEFLSLLVDSIVEFVGFFNGVNGNPARRSDWVSLEDDISAMFSPDQWGEFIQPYLNQFFDSLGTHGHTRAAHIEDLTPEHLIYLEKIGLSQFDSGVSAKLSPKIISERIRIPFGWRLCNFHLPSMDENAVRDFVFKAASDGASFVFMYISDGMTDAKNARKVNVFIETCKAVEKMIQEGALRESILDHVSVEGKKRFWDHWPE